MIITDICIWLGLPRWLNGKESGTKQETRVQSLGLEDPLEEEMATHSSIPAWKITLTEEPGKYSPWGHKRVRHDLEIKRQVYDKYYQEKKYVTETNLQL